MLKTVEKELKENNKLVLENKYQKLYIICFEYSKIDSYFFQSHFLTHYRYL